jgi:hypothetical protein
VVSVARTVPLAASTRPPALPLHSRSHSHPPTGTLDGDELSLLSSKDPMRRLFPKRDESERKRVPHRLSQGEKWEKGQRTSSWSKGVRDVLRSEGMRRVS